MRKIMLILGLLSMSAYYLFAEADIKPYGSARLGYWYENLNKDMTGYDKTDMDLNYMLQTNSRFGVNFKNDNLTAKVELGSKDPLNLRLLWAKFKFTGYSVLIGQDNDGTNEYSAQVYGEDLNLIGYGAVDGGRNPMVKMELDNGFYFSLIKLYTDKDPASVSDTKKMDILFPKLNLGYKIKMDNLYFHPTFVYQSYSYDKDATTVIDGSVNSWLVACTAQMNLDPLTIRAHVNYGINTGNMGYKGPSNKAKWDSEKNETIDTTTMGGFGEIAFKMNDTMTFDSGVGFASSANDTFVDANNKKISDSQMSAYAQMKIKMSKLQLIPEIGIVDNMKKTDDTKEGSKLYFGTQLRMDF